MCQCVRDGRQPAECAMWAVVVAAMSPVFGHAADVVEGFEDVAIEDFGPERPVEPLDVAFCVGLPGWMWTSATS